MKEIRAYRGSITVEEAERLRKVSQSIEPSHKKATNLDTQELVNIGSRKMKQDGFRVASAREDERTL